MIYYFFVMTMHIFPLFLLVVCIAFAEEGVIVELLESWPVQRLKKLHCEAVLYYVRGNSSVNRFERSFEKLQQMKERGGTIEEQIGVLLSEVSHIAFSEIGDLLFCNRARKVCYRQVIHQWFLERSGLQFILEKHGFCIDSIPLVIEEDVSFAQEELCCRWFFEAIRRAISIGALQMSDLYWGAEEEIWILLHAIDDAIVQQYLTRMYGECIGKADDSLSECTAIAAVN